MIIFTYFFVPSTFKKIHFILQFIVIMNVIKSCSLKSKIFGNNYEEMNVKYLRLQLYSAV